MAEVKPDTKCVEPAKGPLVATETPSSTSTAMPKEERKMIARVGKQTPPEKIKPRIPRGNISKIAAINPACKAAGIARDH